MTERQASNLEVRGSNPGPGSNFSLEFQLIPFVKATVLAERSDFLHFFSLVPSLRIC